MNFEAISEDRNGDPVRCSYCARGAQRVVLLPLADRPGLEDRIRAADGGQLWLGLCAYCVLAMARALAAAKGKLP